MFKRTYKGIANITEAHKQEVVDLLKSLNSNKMWPNQQHIKRLFELYHIYVHRSPSDRGCPSCVQIIYKYWKKQQDLWNQH